MSYGFRVRNGNDVITIDENLHAFIYLGKAAIPTQIGTYATVDFNCVGFPLVFFDVPYNITAQDAGPSGSITSYQTRTGIAMVKLISIGTNQWRATFAVSNFNGPDLGLYMRYFGRAHLNAPNGSGETVGLRVRAASGEIVFDSGLDMMRLTADTYSTEMTLPWQVPDSANNSGQANACDTSVSTPVNLQNKSIAATTRGVVHWPYYIGSYTDFDTGQLVDQFDILAYQTLYWANGSTLYARRIAPDTTRFEATGYLGIDNSACQTVYSRLAIVDNTKYP